MTTRERPALRLITTQTPPPSRQASPQEQLGVLLDDHSVPATYGEILAVRCPRCGSGAGHRCRTGKGKPTYPHTQRIQDAVSSVAYRQEVQR